MALTSTWYVACALVPEKQSQVSIRCSTAPHLAGGGSTYGVWQNRGHGTGHTPLDLSLHRSEQSICTQAWLTQDCLPCTNQSAGAREGQTVAANFWKQAGTDMQRADRGHRHG